MKRLITFFQNLKYRKKLVLLCMLVSLLPLSIMGSFCYRQTIRLLRSQELSALESSITAAVNSLETKITLYQNLLRYLALSQDLSLLPSINEATPSEQYEYLNYQLDVLLNSVYAQYPDISRITIYNAEGSMTHGPQLRPVSDLSQEFWYSYKRITNQPAWYKNRDGSICVIQFIANPYIKYVRSYSSNCIAVYLQPEALFDGLECITEDYHIQISSPKQTFFSFYSPDINKSRRQEQDWVTLTKIIPGCDWTVVLERPSQVVFYSVRQMAWIIISIILICVLLIVLITRLFTNFFVEKIDALHYYMEHIKDGELDFHIHDDSTDELGDLTNNLQAMIDEINRLIREEYQMKLELKETQFKALQAQINPHFLYNCLSLINNKALMNHQPQISQMSQLLSVFYRTTLNKGRFMTKLQDEIKNVISYIDIQRLLHEDAFDAIYQIDSDLPELEVPNLLLQPLVENALVHGILPNKEKRGQLFLTITRVRDQIHFTVMDNGLGIPPEKLSTLLQTDSAGYGLKNVHERICHVFGDPYGITINSIPKQSTMITFRLPLTS